MKNKNNIQKKTILKKIINRTMKKMFGNKSVLFLGGVMLILLFVFSAHGKASGVSEQEYKYYTSITIEYGDTLWSIADQYMDKEHYSRTSYIAEVKNINHIKNEDMIKEGKMLIIPYFSRDYMEN